MCINPTLEQLLTQEKELIRRLQHGQHSEKEVDDNTNRLNSIRAKISSHPHNNRVTPKLEKVS